jgi:hypothetical protein
MEITTDLRYPVGRYAPPAEIARGDRAAWIKDLVYLPAALQTAVDGLSEHQLDTPYRPGGWSVRQVVHHLADSHLNAYCRFKLALTEDNPTIKPYEEARWAELPDSTGPIDMSLDLVDALHRRWVPLLHEMRDDDWERTFFHPEQNRALRLDWVLGLYAWHSRHHVAHVTALREREGW